MSFSKNVLEVKKSIILNLKMLEKQKKHTESVLLTLNSIVNHTDERVVFLFFDNPPPSDLIFKSCLVKVDWCKEDDELDVWFITPCKPSGLPDPTKPIKVEVYRKKN